VGGRFGKDVKIGGKTGTGSIDQRLRKCPFLLKGAEDHPPRKGAPQEMEGRSPFSMGNAGGTLGETSQKGRFVDLKLWTGLQSSAPDMKRGDSLLCPKKKDEKDKRRKE